MTSETLDTISQFGIGLLGATALWMVFKKNRWGCVIGLISQPFWIYTTVKNEQWGIVSINLIYIWLWGSEVYRTFFQRPKPPDGPPAE